MHHVYFLQSISKPEEPYTGETNNLMRRFDEHNYGDDQQAHTYKFRPWKMVSTILTDNRDTALVVEEYFKNRSGREKFYIYKNSHPDSKNPINDFFLSLKVGRGFGKRANNSRFVVAENNGTPVFVMDSGKSGENKLIKPQ